MTMPRLAYSYREMFGKDNFFLEIQDHGLEQDKRLTPAGDRLSMDTGNPAGGDERLALPA